MTFLKSQDEIMSAWSLSTPSPVVSICCTAFNHEKYIEDALKGFLIQETNFPFEVLINDDASTDNTAYIIAKYAEAYPDIVKPIFQTENQYSKGVKVNACFNFSRAKGEYIALCEGDDYWTAAHKLQSQKDFMDGASEYSFCFHDVKQLDETANFSAYDAYSKINKTTVNSKDVILNHFIPTLSLFFRRSDFVEFIPLFKGDFISGDVFIEVLLSTKGSGYFFKNEWGIYRHHDGGVTKGVLGIEKTIRSIESNKILYETLLDITPSVMHKHLKLAYMIKVGAPLLRVNLYKGNYINAVLCLIRGFHLAPLWPFLYLKRRVEMFISKRGRYSLVSRGVQR